MGNCCSNSHVDNNDVKREHHYDPQFMERLKQPSMIAWIVKIQAAFRGYMARKYVKAIKQEYYTVFNRRASGGPGMMHFANDGTGDIVYNYDNPDVMVTIFHE